jgi:hypothetical protein
VKDQTAGRDGSNDRRATGWPNRITRAFANGAEREAAYRLDENGVFSATAIAASIHGAAARRAADYERIVMPIDGVAFTMVYQGKGFGEMTRWVADIGGYTGKSSGGPPGIRVIARGFERVEAAAVAIASLRKDRRTRG